MATKNLKSATPDTTVPADGFLFGADSQGADSPSIYPVSSVIDRVFSSTTFSTAVSTAVETKFEDIIGDASSLGDTLGEQENRIEALETGLQLLTKFGAVGDGSTDDTTGVTTADAITSRKFVPDGVYDTTLASVDLDGPYWGPGQIRDTANYKRGPWFSAVKSQPSSLGTWTSAETAFNGDLSKCQIAMEHRITGSSTLTQPSTGYAYVPEASPFAGYLYNSSGHNQSTSGNDGRTGCPFFYTAIFHAGQGDVSCYTGTAFVNGTKSGSTNFLANPAAVLYNGHVDAGADGVYLNAGELYLDGGAYDCAGVGWVINLERNVATGAKEVYWAGFRAQSVGSQAADVAFSVRGAFKYGFDTSQSTLTNNAAISLAADQRIYGNATADSSVLGRFPASTGDDYFTFSSSLNAWNFITNNTSVLQIYETQLSITKPVVLSGSSSGSTTLQASAAASGTLTLPAATDTLVGRDTTDTLTNKTLTSPTFTGTVNLTALSASGNATWASASAYSPQLTNRNTTNDSSGPYFIVQKRRGSAAVQVGDALGTFLFQGADSSGADTVAGYLVCTATAVGAGSVTADFQMLASGRALITSSSANLYFNSGNLGIGGESYGGATRAIYVQNGTAPSSDPSGGGLIYVESGALKYRGSSGTITTIAAA